MNENPIDQTERQMVADLQSQLDELRKRLNIAERGEILFSSDLTDADDEIVLSEADGFGGGILRVVEGNYPVDFVIRKERFFLTEAEAASAAEALVE
jgi:hypothetical protein